jgi:hypothetical protein
MGFRRFIVNNPPRGKPRYNADLAITRFFAFKFLLPRFALEGGFIAPILRNHGSTPPPSMIRGEFPKNIIEIQQILQKMNNIL